MLRSILLWLALLPAIAALIQQPYPGSIHPPRSAPLRLRGGLGDVDPNLVAKGMIGFQSVTAVVFSLAPTKAAEGFTVPLSFLGEWLTETQGLLTLSAALLSFLTISGKTSITHACGWATVPSIVGNVKTLLNNTHKKLGLAAAGQYFALLLNCAVCYALFTADAATGIKILKGWAAWGFLNGILFMLSPGSAGKAWGAQSLTEMEAVITSGFGAHMLCYSSLGMALALGHSPAKAVGYAQIPHALFLVDQLLLRKTALKLGANAAATCVFFAVTLAAIAGTLA